MKNPIKYIGELVTMNWDVSRSSWFGPGWSALRGFVESFFKRPIAFGTVVDYDLARSLYRNDSQQFNLGAGFVKPIIDLSVEYIGIPTVSATPDDAFLNECITDYWAPQLAQIFRDSMRDSKTIVRYRQPRLNNPLFTETDRIHGKLELIPPEEVDITFDPTDYDLIARAVITHEIKFDERTDDEVAQGVAPRQVIHEVMEIITPDMYKFYDKTAGRELESWTVFNEWGFVPMWPIWNEYQTDLGGGISDIENVMPFISAFQDVMQQALASHKYHSAPKVKFNLKDVNQFIANNWPNAIDETTGRVKEGAKVDLSGREIYFFGADEDGDFLEATSVLGDTKTLLEFLIDCICIAAETPRWAILAAGGAVQESDASVQPFVKKINRKRIQFSDCLVIVCKMALVANGKVPNTPRINWAPVRLLDLVSKGQAIQQLIMGFDVATQHQWISDLTVVRILGNLFDEITDPEQEMEDAKNNIVPEIPAPAPLSGTQPAPPPAKGSTNGKTTKAAGKKALATTAASKS